MEQRPVTSVMKHFGDLPDPRVERTKLHSLLDIMTIAILAVLCGAEGWEDMEEFGESKQEWLRSFLPLENGIPCADTFRRVFAAINPESFERCFMNWVRSLSESLEGKVVAIDGKTLRGSYDRAGQQSPLHLVHAFAAENQILLGQVSTDVKSNEITAIPELLALLDLQGSIVTIDAMGCQTKIAQEIVDGGADYILALKGNQGILHQEVADFFTEALQDEQEKLALSYAESTCGDHGRIETRRVWSSVEVACCSHRQDWAKLNSVILVESERECKGQTTMERRYYISSLKNVEATEFATMIRSHWAIENNLHWSLDVAFKEDACRIRKDHAPHNLSLLRKLGLTLLKRSTKSKRGIAAKARRAGWDHNFLLAVLKQGGQI